MRAITPELAALLIPRLQSIAPLPHLADQAALVPIPLHKRRQRQRGFNQSEDLALAIHRYTNIPVYNLLTRVRSTWTQSHLPHELRAGNTSNAFAIKSDVIRRLASPSAARRSWDRRIQTLILIDDVTTTGATLNAAAQALQPHLPGGSQIWAATVARG